MDSRLKKIILLLASVQFIFTLDTTFMNVSISTLVVDLHTTITGIQGAITLYTLIMAAFMIAGAKIGDIIGRKKAFIIGLSIYTVGSLITSLSPNLFVLMLGWSVLEGLGAALAIPAMFSLITGSFKAGPMRAKAYGMLAAMAAIGAASGPIVGGLLTTYASWRLGFAAEVLVGLFVLSQHKSIVDTPKLKVIPKFDFVGLFLSAVGLGIIVFGVLLANTYGLFKARADFSIFGIQICHTGGVAPSIYFVIAGVAILAGFLAWQIRQSKRGGATLITPAILKVGAVKAGSSSVLSQQFILAGVIFSLSIYLQLSLGYNAFQTGLTILPMSIMLLIFARLGAKLSTMYPPRSIVMAGFLIMVGAVIFLGFRIGKLSTGTEFIIPMSILGIGLGFSASQLGNIVQSSVKADLTSEASGISSTFQNLGSSLGTAIAGTTMIAVLIATSTTLIAENSTLNSSQKTQYTQVLQSNAQIVSNATIENKLAGQPEDVVNAVVSINQTARNKALKVVVYVLGVLGITGLIAAWALPKTKPLEAEPVSV